MLTEIRLDKFKSFGEPTTIPLGKVTVFLSEETAVEVAVEVAIEPTPSVSKMVTYSP